MVNLLVNGATIENIDTVLFDKDGTLTDVNLYWGKIIEMRAWAIVQFYKLDRQEYFKLQIAMGYIPSQKKLCEEGPIAIKCRKEVIWAIRKYLKSIGVEATAIEIDTIINQVNDEFRPISRSYISLIPGVLDFLKLLKKHNVKMAVTTSDSLENANEALRVTGIASYFTCVFGHESSRAAKDTGIPAKELLLQIESDPENTIVIGDTSMDVNMAVNSNTRGCIVTATGQIPYERFAGVTPFVVRNMKDIGVAHA